MSDKMVIRLSKTNLRYGGFIFLLLVLDVCFMDIAWLAEPLYGVNNNHNKWLMSLLIILAFTYLVLKRSVDISLSNPYDAFVVMYLGIVIITFVGSLIVYDQSIIAVLKNYYYYMILLFYFVLKYMLRRKKFYDVLVKLIIGVSAFYSSILIAAKIYYEMSGKFLLSQQLLIMTVRNDSLRLMNISGLISWGAVLAFSFALKKKRSWFFYLICGIACVAEVFYVSQTRMAELAIILSACIMLYFYSDKRKKWFLLTAVFILAAICSTEIAHFLGSFSLNSDVASFAYSTSIRLEAYGYFLKNAFRNLMFGIGFINSSKYSDIKLGPKGRYVISDLGYIGIIGVFGILGVFLIKRVLDVYIGQARRVLWKSKQKEYPEVLGIVAYTLISSWSLIFNDIQRMLYLPICLAILNFINEECMDDCEKVLLDEDFDY